MAEARSEEEEENMMRDTREQVVRRQPNTSGGRPDRRKPEHRHSQGPLSSIRAAIKRTSNRSTSLSESSRDRDRDRDRDRERDRERDRDRDRDRDRRRPEITILSAEPLASTSWFPGASGGFPPPPPPAAQIWGSTIPPSIQPPPSYEEVIREKTQEQVLRPPPSSFPSSSSPSASSSSSRPASTITIATQTDPGSGPDLQDSQARRPVRPPRPRLSYPLKPTHVDDITAASQSAGTSLDSDGGAANTRCCDLTELCSPLTLAVAVQSDQWDQSAAAVDVATPPPASSGVPSERPKPRPRSRLSAPPISSEVKVQTLVKLRDDGFATLAARAGNDSANQEAKPGTYLQELLEAFSADDWGFPDRRSDSSEHSQSEDEEDEGEEEDMATLKARIQAFEQQQQVADESCGDSAAPKRPEPRPRPRLQGQPAKSAPPTVAPKPKNFSHGPKPSTKGFWEEHGGPSAVAADAENTETPSVVLNPKPQTASEPELAPKPAPAPVPQPCKPTEKPSITPKPPPATETSPSGTLPPPSSVPVPAPRPPPPKLPPSSSETPSQAKPPPRPPVAPRASVGAPNQERSPRSATPTVPPRPPGEVCAGPQTETAGDKTQDAAKQPAKTGSGRPGIPSKPATLTSPRRASAPNLAPKPTAAAPAPKPSGPTAGPKPPTPAPAVRKGPPIQTKPDSPNPSDPPLPPRPSSVKLLPLRPPPIKSTPGRPPPPAVTSASSANHVAPPPSTASKTSPAPSVSTANQPPSSQTTPAPSAVSANQTPAQRVAKKGPPLPPRPKPGHPLYNSYEKQEVLIVLDDPTPPEHLTGDGGSQTAVTPLIDPSQSLLDLDTQPETVPEQESQSKAALEGLGLSDSQSILPVQPTELKDQPDRPTDSGPRCVALFDYEGEEDDELTFSQGDVIALLELIGQEWGRGQIHGRIGIFPLNFTEVLEPPSPRETATTMDPKQAGNTAQKTTEDPDQEQWAVALFDFPGQTAEDLSFHKGALIRVLESVDAEWRRGRLEGKEGLYPAAFTQAIQAQPITGQQSDVKAVAKFDFTAESEDELTLKVGDIITQVESVDEQWIMGVVGGKRGVAPKNYISPL